MRNNNSVIGNVFVWRRCRKPGLSLWALRAKISLSILGRGFCSLALSNFRVADDSLGGATPFCGFHPENDFRMCAVVQQFAPSGNRRDLVS
jgi:hypothetical protein